jgi:hypothetical protein
MLRRQGFRSAYHVFGDSATQIEQIQHALPPPLAEALADSIHEHIDSLTNALQTVNKRKPEEELQDGGSTKRVRWSSSDSTM